MRSLWLTHPAQLQLCREVHTCSTSLMQKVQYLLNVISHHFEVWGFTTAVRSRRWHKMDGSIKKKPPPSAYHKHLYFRIWLSGLHDAAVQVYSVNLCEDGASCFAKFRCVSTRPYYLLHSYTFPRPVPSSVCSSSGSSSCCSSLITY